jgi:adenylate kinase family enzyme
MKRVLLVGSPGTGKSTFARKLAAKKGLPVIHLDRYYNDAKLGYANDEPKWNKFIEATIARETWIIDGNYSGSMGIRMRRADTIIVFEYPRWRAFLGLARRRIEYHNKVRPDMPDGWRERVDFGFLKFVWNFNVHYKVSKLYVKLEATDQNKIVRFSNPKDAQRYLEAL